MRGKYLFILFLLALLVFTVYKMMQFESHIREERQVKLFVEDESKPLLSKLSDEEITEAATNSDYYFIADGDFFRELKTSYREDKQVNTWDGLFLKGVNMGVAVPGKFPAEFSLSFDEYLSWIRMIGEMNANIIRLYTILPPEFYEAFAYYNLHYNDKPVYLMQGVWAEVPESENYYDPDFIHEFEKEIIDVIDVIHGNAVLKEHPGKASGVYSTDVSRNVAAILLGREWEPGSVFKTNKINKIDRYNGDFVSMNNGNAMEAWLAKIMDFTVLYETQLYRFQRPVSFVNWLPLDPMYHNTEIIENSRVREYDNDLEAIDFIKFQTTDLFQPGIFAAYHAYPYYPDFIYLQDSYSKPAGIDSVKGAYYNYLVDLKQHNQGMPLVIAEYGLPSSRGNSHVEPSGFNQGGHSEAEQAELSLQLTRDIIGANCAGAIYFEWIDEWFKHNWLVMDFEQPEDDRKLWHNMENPEQNFGILALENKIKTIDGSLNDWKDISFSGQKTDLAFNADASYFYLASVLPGFDPENQNLYIAIDTYDREKGDHKLPFSDKVFPNGFEFLVSLNSYDSAFILVDEPYSVFTDIYNNYVPVYASKENVNGDFIHELMLTNRSRTSLTGEKTDSVMVDRGRLLFGKSSDPRYSNADWYYDRGSHIMELRLDWALLNVSSPAKRFVLDDKAGTGAIEYIATDAFKIVVFITDKQDHVIEQFPADEPLSYIWEGWDTPAYTARLKPVYFTLRDYFKDLTINQQDRKLPSDNESFRITGFFENKEGAISISFDNASYSQYEYGLPVLNKYGMSAGFGVIPGLLENSPRVTDLQDDARMKRLSIREVKEMAIDHEIALQALPGEKPDDSQFFLLGEKSESKIYTLHSDVVHGQGARPHSPVFIRKISPRDLSNESFDGVNYTLSGVSFSQQELDHLLADQKGKWTLFVYHHLYDNPAEIPHMQGELEASRLFTQISDYEQQLRLYRNSNYWIASESDIFRYLKEKMESSVVTEKYQNMIFLKVINRLDADKFDMPLTIEFKSAARFIRVEGSETDGIYSGKNGSYLFNVMPNREIVIEIIE
jgi:hypothetical protein